MKVAVVGAGIGGLTTAIALARKGIDAVVYEQARELAPVGASLALGPNATRLLDDLGLLDELRRVGVRAEAVELLRWTDGSVLLHTELGAAAEAYFGAPALDFHRADVQQVLLDALPPGVLRLGARVTQVGEGWVEVDGERHEADAVVAADGIRSPVRQQLAGADDPVFSGTVVYRGIAAREAVADLHRDETNRYWLGPYRHGVSYRISGGRELAVTGAVQQAEWSRESWVDPAEPDEVLRYFEGWDPAFLERLRRCHFVQRNAVFIRRPLERWSYGRVTLLGDAAHAMEPFQAQGAAQAVEDAYVLAECLAGADDAPAALAEYERERRSRASELQESSSVAAASFYLPDGPEQRERDAAYARLHETHPWGHRQTIWEHDVRSTLSLRR